MRLIGRHVALPDDLTQGVGTCCVWLDSCVAIRHPVADTLGWSVKYIHLDSDDAVNGVFLPFIW